MARNCSTCKHNKVFAGVNHCFNSTQGVTPSQCRKNNYNLWEDEKDYKNPPSPCVPTSCAHPETPLEPALEIQNCTIDEKVVEYKYGDPNKEPLWKLFENFDRTRKPENFKPFIGDDGKEHWF